MKNPLTRSRLGEDNWLEPIIFVIYRLKWEKLNDLVNLFKYFKPEQGYGQQCSVSCYLKSCGLALFDVDSSVSRFKWVASRPGQRSFYTQGYDSGYVWNAGCRKYLSGSLRDCPKIWVGMRDWRTLLGSRKTSTNLLINFVNKTDDRPKLKRGLLVKEINGTIWKNRPERRFYLLYLFERCE